MLFHVPPARGFCTSQEETTSILHRCLTEAFVTCSAAVGHGTEKLKSLAWQRAAPGFVSLQDTSGLVRLPVRGPASPRDGGRGHNTAVPQPTFVPYTRRLQGTEGPRALSTMRRRREMNPQTFYFCLFHLFLN